MFNQWKKIAATLSAAALLGMNAGITSAQEHSHAHHGEKPAKLTLDNGKKWATDDNLRQGMEKIRDALEAELPAVHSGKATVEQYRALAEKIDDQIAFVVKNCRLDQKTDATLHLVLADIIAGTESMKAKSGSKARKGAEKIMRALDNYGAYFNHPGWHGITPVH
ncbi:MAG: hypothetical protein K2P67_03045 [Gallionellaceae bacterium]|jgi:hypothetical protein|nr:hypothetical protein [Gallionellaceae bacterium]